MHAVDRRSFLLGAAGLLVSVRSLAQDQASQNGLFESLKSPGRIGLPESAATQQVFDSPAPKAADPGRWLLRAPLPSPRSEMAWAAAYQGKMHLIGGYGDQRVDRPYHNVYVASADAWITGAPLPRGANHVGVAVLEGRLYAIGGFVEQNRRPHDECFVLDLAGGTWQKIAPLPAACGAIACVALEGKLHSIGGAIGDTFPTKRSVDWHLVYDPHSDRWEHRAPLPLGRDHTGAVAVGSVIHVVGGRVNSFLTNSNLHDVYDPLADRWESRRPLPTARSGHGAVLYRRKIFVMGGEGYERVYGQNEAYDPESDRWEAYAPMLTPRHGLGAAAIGDFIYVVGGGPMMGGAMQSAVNEAFTLG